MLFLVDAQLPPKLKKILENAGFQAEHVSDLGMARALDTEIWQYAEVNNQIIISKDRGFSNMAKTKKGPQIIWLTCNNIRNKDLFSKLLLRLPRIITNLQAGQRVVEEDLR